MQAFEIAQGQQIFGRCFWLLLPGLLGHELTDTVGYWKCFYGAQGQDWRITAVLN
jgi:hypothetical protein